MEKSTSKKQSECLESTVTYSHWFIPVELEEGIEVSQDDESYVINSDERTFESKISSTFIESNEEFIYSTKDLIPCPLKLDWIKKFTDKKEVSNRAERKETKDTFRTNYNVKPILTERNGNKLELATDRFNNTSNPWTDSNSKISSYIGMNPLLTDEKSTFRNITNRSNNMTNKKENQCIITNHEIQDYWDRISKMVHLMDSSVDSNPFNECDELESDKSQIENARLFTLM